jgi:hypothetical protein
MGFLSRFFSAAEAPKPVLLRVRSRAGAPQSVEVRAQWAPSGRVLFRELLTADGLCLVPWLTDASGVDLTIRSEGRSGRVELALADTREGAVFEVDLDERVSVVG